MWLVLVLCLVSTASSLDHVQIHGLKNLVKNLKEGMFATCNLIIFTDLVDYDTAENNCENFDIGTGRNLTGNLATVNDKEKNKDLKMLLKLAYPLKDNTTLQRWDYDQWVWAGLRKTQNNDGSKLNRQYDPLDWEWADGSHPNDFEMWLNKQPDQKKNGEYLQNQMRINHHGHWDDTFKDKTHPYACDYQGKYILSANRKSWSQAKAACESANLILAKVRSGQEVIEVTKAAEYFLGSRDTAVTTWHYSNWIWLGGTDAVQEDKWTWTDGEPIEYFDKMNWRPPNPDNAAFIKSASENVLAISKWGQFDDSYDSRRRKRPFACQCPNT